MAFTLKFVVAICIVATLSAQSVKSESVKYGVWENCNFAADLLLGILNIGTPKGDAMFPIDNFKAGSFKFIGIQIGDMSSLRRTGDAYRMEPYVDTMQVNGSYGLRNFEASVNNIISELGESGPVKITAVTDSVDIFYTMNHKTKRDCSTDWSKFKITELTGINVISKKTNKTIEDLSQLLESKIVDALNELISKPETLHTISRNIDFCLRLF